ncbi:MAG: hypothetical protein JWO67_702 [Streptosporangiaceae bacterium]|nr:hypothetical protein [Streptosporangiaceae bacterium]
MSFNPLEHRGIPLEEQIRNWSELDVAPIDPDLGDPYTKCRVLTLNSVEIQSIKCSHEFTRHCGDPEVRQHLSLVRYIEQQQQKVVAWLLPGQASVLETTIGHEQTAVDLTAWVARMEPDPYLKQTFEFGVLEDFDHLYRYANLYDLIEHRAAEKIVDGVTEVMPGRPTPMHHRHPYDNVRKPYDRNTVDPRSRLHALTILAAEEQVMTYYMETGPHFMEPIARQLYQEISMVEEEHVTHYETLLDPAETWWERLVLQEYNECYLYYSFMLTETDPRLKAIWELHLNMEVEHLRLACELMRRHDDRDPHSLLPAELPEPVTFEPQKAYLRELLATQLDLTTLGTGYVREAHERFERMQARVNGAEKPPSERVVQEHTALYGSDYRFETEGTHPVERLREVPKERR